MIKQNSTHDYFKVTVDEDNTPIEAAIKLLTQDYIELKKAAAEEAPTMLFIDRDAKVFWFCDAPALTTIERLYRLHKSKVTEVDLQEIDGWFQAVTAS